MSKKRITHKPKERKAIVVAPRVKGPTPIIRGKHIPCLLYDLLTTATPGGSEQLVYKFLPKGGETDEAGNVLYRVGKPSVHHTMFSSHLDTVQRGTEKRTLVMDKDKFIYACMPNGQPSVLGADDKIGVYVMLQMMKKKIPGLYVFHTGEEIGGIGSSWLVKNKPEYFEHIDRCIAFDRMDYNDVITHQGGQRCCSPEFAKALSEELNEYMPSYSQYAADATGSFTDSDNYVGLIAECTNLSIGYFRQHTTNEHFDPIWLGENFIPAVLGIDWTKLPTARTPEEKSTYVAGTWGGYGNNYGGYGGNSMGGGYTPALSPWDRVSTWTQEDRIPPLQPEDKVPFVDDQQLLKGIRKHYMHVTSAQFLVEVLALMRERDLLMVEKESLESDVRIMNQWGYGV